MEAYANLQQLIKWLTYKSNIHICIHFLSGDWQDDAILAINPLNKVHSCSFCKQAKTTKKGLQLCMRNKKKSIEKALMIKNTYLGQCYLGVTEIVHPLFVDNSPFCIIYLGNLLISEQTGKISDRMEFISKITKVESASLKEYWDTLEEVSNNDISHYLEIVKLISSYIHMYIVSLPKPKEKKANNVHWIVEQTLTYIEQFYNTDIRLSEIANLFYINPQYLCRLFSKQVGISFTQYIAQTRVKNAKELLSASDNRIIDIAYSVGFNSVTYFNSTFKKYEKVTPSEYRMNS